MAIDLGDGATHGSAIAFDAKSAPGRGERMVSTVLDFDAARYRAMLLGAALRAMPQAAAQPSRISVMAP